MKKLLARLKTVNLGTFLRQMPYYIFGISATSFLFPVFVHILRGQVTEIDSIAIIGTVWVFIAMVYWIYASRADHQHLIDTRIIDQQVLEIRARENLYYDLLGAVRKIGPKTLRLYGISLTGPERIVN